MKKLLYKVSASLCIALAATSCLDDILDVESQSFDASIVYSNYTLAEYNLFNIANVCVEDQAYNARLDLWYGFNTDTEMFKSSYAKNGLSADTQLCEYNTLPSNGTMATEKNGYVHLMNGIEKANVFLSEMRQYANFNDPDMASLYGEALTWRAFFYSEIVKMWGEAPLRTAPVTSETMYLPKSDRDELYKLILGDLEEAIPLLYKPFEKAQTSTTFRVSRAVACGLYARVALAATGYSWRPDDGLVGTGNYGSLRLSVDEQFTTGKEELYKKALKFLEDEVIADPNVYLTPSFEKLLRDFCNDDHISNNHEVLWIRPFSNGRGRWIRTHGISYKNSRYTNYSSGTHGGSTGPNPTMWWKYGKNDTRRDVTCVPWMHSEESGKDYIGFQISGNTSFWYNGKFRFEWRVSTPFTGSTSDGAKPVLLRYADILLMASELAYYLDETDKAKNYLLQVRERAYADNKSEAAAYVNALDMSGSGIANSADAADKYYNVEGSFMKALIDERALEFVGEMLRKGDLIRWKLLKKKLDDVAVDMKHLAEMTDEFAAYGNVTDTNILKTKTSSDSGNEYKEYSIFWRLKVNSGYPEVGANPVEIFGLEADQIGQYPADYSEMEQNGWVKKAYIASEYFYGSSSGDYIYNIGLYHNDFNDPYPRSYWPHFNTQVTTSQGSLVNDYGY